MSLSLPELDPVVRYILIPLLIFCTRIIDVSISTLRIIFVVNDKRFLSSFLGTIEALVWLIAISQIIQNVHDAYSYIAYAAGYGTGTYTGMVIEGRLALGRVLVRVVAQKEANQLVQFLKSKDYKYASVPAQGNEGDVNVVFTVVKRDNLSKLIEKIQEFNPKAFYTVESVKKASDDHI